MKISIPREAITEIMTSYNCSEEDAVKAYLDARDSANDAFKSFRGQARQHAQQPGVQRAPEMANTIRMSGQADDKFGWTLGRRRVLRRSRIPDPVLLRVPF